MKRNARNKRLIVPTNTASKQERKRPAARKADLMVVLKKVAPFLFKKRKKRAGATVPFQQEAHVAASARKKTATVRTKRHVKRRATKGVRKSVASIARTATRRKKRAGRKAAHKPVRLPAATLEVQKKVKKLPPPAVQEPQPLTEKALKDALSALDEFGEDQGEGEQPVAGVQQAPAPTALPAVPAQQDPKTNVVAAAPAPQQNAPVIPTASAPEAASTPPAAKDIAPKHRFGLFFSKTRTKPATPAAPTQSKPAKPTPVKAAKKAHTKGFTFLSFMGKRTKPAATKRAQAKPRVSKKPAAKPTKAGAASRLSLRSLFGHKATPKKVQPAAKKEPSSGGRGLFFFGKRTKAEKPVQKETVIDAKDDAFLQKVVPPIKTESAASMGGWRKFSMPLLSFGRKKPAAKQVEKQSLPKDGKADSFLQRVQKKNVKSVVGTSIDEDVLQAEKLRQQTAKTPGEKSSSEAASEETQVKGHIITAAEIKEKAKADKEEANKKLTEDVKELKAALKLQEKEREKEIEKIEADKKAQAEAPTEVVPHIKIAKQKQKGGLQRLVASIGYIGLGKERMHFIQNLATMLNAGLPLIDSLKTLQMETRAKPMKKMLQRILDSVENGSALWRAMEEQSFFSLQALALIRIGEEAGDLAKNIEHLAHQEEKDHELRSKVKMAMIYPSIVITIMLIIVVGLGMFVLPNLIGVLYSLNVPLPLVTRLVIMFSNMFTQYGFIAVPGMIGGFIFLIILAKYTALKGFFQWLMFRVPGIGRLAQEATIARFGVILGGLLKAGVPVIEAMQSMVDVTPIVAYRKLYIRILEHVTIGDSFGKSFNAIRGSQKLLPPSVQQLVITGEKSGALADIMLKIADIYDKKATETAQKLPVILEPMLLLFIGGLVGTIAFAIIVPIYSIVGNVGR